MRTGAVIDPRLGDRITKAGESGQVEAILLLSDQSDAAGGDERGAGGPVLDRVTRQLNERPAFVRFLPVLGAMFVRGSGRLMRALLGQAEVVSASAHGWFPPS